MCFTKPKETFESDPRLSIFLRKEIERERQLGNYGKTMSNNIFTFQKNNNINYVFNRDKNPPQMPTVFAQCQSFASSFVLAKNNQPQVSLKKTPYISPSPSIFKGKCSVETPNHTTTTAARSDPNLATMVPLICAFPGCNRSFTRSSHLQRHFRTHQMFKPYVCTVEGCTSKFNRRDCWRGHMRTVHGISKIDSSLMPPAFHVLSREMRRAHGIERASRKRYTLRTETNVTNAKEGKYSLYQSHHPLQENRAHVSISKFAKSKNTNFGFSKEQAGGFISDQSRRGKFELGKSATALSAPIASVCPQNIRSDISPSVGSIALPRCSTIEKSENSSSSSPGHPISERIISLTMTSTRRLTPASTPKLSAASSFSTLTSSGLNYASLFPTTPYSTSQSSSLKADRMMIKAKNLGQTCGWHGEQEHAKHLDGAVSSSLPAFLQQLIDYRRRADSKTFQISEKCLSKELQSNYTLRQDSYNHGPNPQSFAQPQARVCTPMFRQLISQTGRPCQGAVNSYQMLRSGVGKSLPRLLDQVGPSFMEVPLFCVLERRMVPAFQVRL